MSAVLHDGDVASTAGGGMVTQQMGLVERTEWEPCLVEAVDDSAMERRLRRAKGFVPGWMRFFFPCPWIIETALDLDELKVVHIDLELAEMVSLVVSQDNSCRFCYAAHRLQLRALGVREDRIRGLEENLLTVELDDRVRQALDFVRSVSRSNPPPTKDDLAALHDAGYAPEAVRELAFLAASQLLFNRITTLPALPPEQLEGLPARRIFPVLAPLLRFWRRRQGRRARPRPLPADAGSGPFACIVLALGDLPAARCLHDLIDRSWRSPLLPARTKALIYAVVARALACELAEREARRLLSAEGMAADDVEQILAHLSSDKLDATEAVVVPFSRDTVWYRPAQIQRQSRVLRDQLSQGQFLEVIGVAAVANAICRLSLLAEAES